uniref:mammalian ependymin-related protein 1 n=1 Tax=Oncorhynchus gorbuscha TaxID=8017 RepID=UPI001EAEC3DB|nr:mammalian ependymin-related protein 1 [Oncorhynchus gorbuscha]XP_046197542.1 mammalian ependymin-related protein 1-like [Oncorhynchus gorbuscha]
MKSTGHDFYLHLNEFHISRMTHVVPLVFAFCLGAVVPALSYPETAFAAPVQPCLAPLQWEGRSVEYNHNTGRNTRASVSYDAQNHRIRLLQQNKRHTPCQKYFEFIYLYNSGLLFQIEQKTKQCSKIPLTQAWDPFDIPMNSTYEDQYFIGGPGDMIEVQEWSDRKPARKNEAWVGVYTVKDCYPVQETYTRNSSITTSTRFFDLQLGISDPEVFTPPSSCQSARPERMDSDC